MRSGFQSFNAVCGDALWSWKDDAASKCCAKKGKVCQKRWPLAMSKDKKVDIFKLLFFLNPGWEAGLGRVAAW